MVRILSIRSDIQGMVLTLHILSKTRKLLHCNRSLTFRWTHIPKVGKLEYLGKKEEKKGKYTFVNSTHDILHFSISSTFLKGI